MANAPNLKDIREMPLDELIRRHDDLAKETQVGLEWYRFEIARRDTERRERRMLVMTYLIGFFTFVTTVAAIGVWVRG